MATTDAKSVDQVAVVVREDKVSNVHVLVQILWLCRFASLKATSATFVDFLLNFFSESTFDLLDHVAFQTEGRCVSLVALTATLLVNVVVPVIVAIGWDLKLDRVVASCDSRDVPLKLLDLAALEEPDKRQDEEQADQSSRGDSHLDILVLVRELLVALDAGVLHVQLQVGSTARAVVGRAEIDILAVLADASVESIEQA